MATETLSLNQIQPRLSELVDRARQSLDRFFITCDGHTEAVLLSAEDFEGLRHRGDSGAQRGGTGAGPR